MAIYAPGPLIGAISGNLGGVSFANPSGSKVIRRPRRSSVILTEEQVQQQSYVALFARSWASLEEDERAAWRTWAANRPKPNRIGVQRAQSGYQAFMEYHLAKAVVNTTVIPLPPKSFTPQSLYNFELTSAASSNILVNFTDDSLFVVRRAFIYGRPLFRTSTPKFNNSWKLLGDMQTISSTFQVTPFWDEVFTHPIEGQAIAIRVKVANFPAFVIESVVDLFTITVA